MTQEQQTPVTSPDDTNVEAGRSDSVKHVRHTHADRQGTAWCGVRLWSYDYAFLDIEHAAYNNQNGGRLVPCSACVDAIATALRLQRI